MDRIVISAARHFDDEEDANEAACYRTAARSGHTVKDAEECDDGSVGCPDCPWRKKESNGNA